MGHLYRVLILLLCLLQISDAIRCFECQNVNFPRNCTHVTECNADEHCLTEQKVTNSGHIVYTTGCVLKSHCSSTGITLIGKRSDAKRSSDIKRSSDLTVCMECCKEDFCNHVGCDVNEIPLTQRGPFCFNCESGVDDNACNNVTVCNKGEECNSMSVLMSHDKCPTSCCDTDFCNNRCGVSVLNDTNTSWSPSSSTVTTPMTSQTSQTTVTIKTTVTVKATSHHHGSNTNRPRTCNTDNGYTYLNNSKAELCVRIVLENELWRDARSICRNTGDDLVVLDTHAKAVLLRHYIASHRHYDHSGYWIGARVYDGTHHFSWVNHNPLIKSETDWETGQPNDYNNGHTTACVVMLSSHIFERNYQWNDKSCHGNRYNYICEMLL